MIVDVAEIGARTTLPIVEKVHAEKVECHLCWGYTIHTNTTSKTTDWKYESIFSGEDGFITAFTNLWSKTSAVEEFSLNSGLYGDLWGKLTKRFFQTFTENVSETKKLRSLKIKHCIINVTREDMDDFLESCSLEEFYYMQSRFGRNHPHQGTPVDFISDNFLTSISKSIQIHTACHTFCPQVTVKTIEKWKETLPLEIILQNCHTSFTLLALFELIKIALEKKLCVVWDFGYLDNSEENFTTLVEVQKCKLLCYNTYDGIRHEVVLFSKVATLINRNKCSTKSTESKQSLHDTAVI